MFDFGAATRSHIEDAHDGPVWSLAPLPDRTGFVSGRCGRGRWLTVRSGSGEREGMKRALRRVRT